MSSLPFWASAFSLRSGDNKVTYLMVLLCMLIGQHGTCEAPEGQVFSSNYFHRNNNHTFSSFDFGGLLGVELFLKF